MDESREESVRKAASSLGLSLWKMWDGTYTLTWEDDHLTQSSGLDLDAIEAELGELSCRQWR